MKHSLVATFSLLSLLSAAPTLADDFPAEKVWSRDHTITEVRPNLSYSSVWIYLDRDNAMYEQGSTALDKCNTKNVLLSELHGTEEGRNRAYSTLLAAFLSGRKVDINVFRRGNNGICAIERVVMK